MRPLPKVTFTNDDHTKVKNAMLMHDPMRELLKDLWTMHFDGKDMRRETERSQIIVRKLSEIQKYL